MFPRVDGRRAATGPQRTPLRDTALSPRLLGLTPALERQFCSLCVNRLRALGIHVRKHSKRKRLLLTCVGAVLRDVAADTYSTTHPAPPLHRRLQPGVWCKGTEGSWQLCPSRAGEGRERCPCVLLGGFLQLWCMSAGYVPAATPRRTRYQTGE